METILVSFVDAVNDRSYDLQVPASLSARDLVVALAKAYNLPMNVDDPRQLYMRAENPIVFIEGDVALVDLGISDGTKIVFDPRQS